MRNWFLPAAAGAAILAIIVTLPWHSHQPGAAAPGSIVSLAPNVTEILFALGLQDRLIGVTSACDYPPQARALRKVGDFGAPRLELLYALKPDLVITTDLRDPEVARAIRNAGIRLLLVPQGNLDEVLAAIESIGRAAGATDAARKYADHLRQRIASATVAVPEARRPRVFLEISEKPLSTCARGSFLDDLITRAGGTNIAHDLPRPWSVVSADLVVARDPQIIILAHPVPSGGPSLVADRIGWKNIAAVKSGFVVADLNLDTILRPGPRLADGLEALSKLIARYPEATSP